MNVNDLSRLIFAAINPHHPVLAEASQTARSRYEHAAELTIRELQLDLMLQERGHFTRYEQ
jgi:hypothetical protein